LWLWAAESRAEGHDHVTEIDVDVAKLVNNPLAETVTLEAQPSFNFGVGPSSDTEYVFNLQANIPIPLGAGWDAVARTVLPLVNEPSGAPGEDYTFGLGDLQETVFVSPPSSEDFIWGFGPVLQLPTATATVTGSGKWAVGPTIAAVFNSGPWQVAGQVNDLWSFAGHRGRPALNLLLLQPVVNYSLSPEWFLTCGPSVTVDWKAGAGDRWTVPVGAGFGRIFTLGSRAWSLQTEAYWNVVHPADGPRWSLILTVQLLFPE